MNRSPENRITVTDVTLREFGQNVPAAGLDVFTPEIRVAMARRLAGAGFRRIEVFSCVSPKVAPAMNGADIRKVADGLGRMEGVTVVTAVPNRSGYGHFLSMGLGPDGYGHEMGVFFSAVEAHNVANLGRTIPETLREYGEILKDAGRRGIRVAGYVSAAFGYRPPGETVVLRPRAAEINTYVDWYLDLGAKTVTLSDLQGVADEAETVAFFRQLLDGRARGDIGLLGYHPHHVSGAKAVANSLAARNLGIRRFDASLGGTGGCVTGAPGNQPTELLVEALHAHGVGTGLDAEEVRSLALLADATLYQRITRVSSLRAGKAVRTGDLP